MFKMSTTELNKYQLIIMADDRQVVLERILQVTRYRGFLINGMNAEVNTGNNIATITMTVSSNRSIALLVDQINKLIDIKDVKVDNSAEKMSSKLLKQQARNIPQ
jgi:acetolactate synthase II small subunit